MLERIAGIEPASWAWKALALPLSYIRNVAGSGEESNLPYSLQSHDTGLPYRWATEPTLVATGGIEPPASRLSSGCSAQLSYVAEIGGLGGDRTRDLLGFNQALYLLSYRPMKLGAESGIRTRTRSGRGF